MDRELQGDAPRVIKLKNELQWSLWTKKQLEDQQLNTYERQVADGYWLLEEESWQFHQGILPEYESTGHEVAVVEFAEDFFKEDLYEPGEDKQLARSSRKALKKKMRQLVVSEVFSPPRVCQEAEAQGHLAGGSFDLVTGYDLTVAKDQRRCWKALTEADPDILVVCPPCGPFSILQSLNQARGSHTLALKLKEGRACLRFAMEVFRWQTARKKLAILARTVRDEDDGDPRSPESPSRPMSLRTVGKGEGAQQEADGLHDQWRTHGTRTQPEM